MSGSPFREPRRGVQLYSREKALEFIHLSAEEKLSWLDEINMLYWAGASQVRDASGPRSEKKRS